MNVAIVRITSDREKFMSCPDESNEAQIKDWESRRGSELRILLKPIDPGPRWECKAIHWRIAGEATLVCEHELDID